MSSVQPQKLLAQSGLRPVQMLRPAVGHARNQSADVIALLDIIYGKRRTVEKLAMLGYSPKYGVTKARDLLLGTDG